MSGPPPARGGLSLYANLLDPGGTSDSPSANNDAVANKQQNVPAKKAVNPAFAFQPIRRPQVKQPNKPKPTLPKAPPSISIAAVAATVKTSEPDNNGTTATTTSAAAAAVPQQRNTLADWVATEDDEYLYSGSNNRRERGGRRRKKKKNDDRPVETNWDELYDPARPTNVEEYLRSDERIREIRDWKAVLYAHRRKRRDSFDSRRSDEEEEDDRRVMNIRASGFFLVCTTTHVTTTSYNNHVSTGASGSNTRRRICRRSIRPKISIIRHGATTTITFPLPPQPPAAEPSTTDPATISRAPVRYEAPPQPPSAPEGSGDDAMDIDSEDEEVNYDAIPVPLGTHSASEETEDANAPKSKLPGQAGFAARLMSKYGWTAGSGLGASESGITSALQVKVEKRKKRSDAEGGGWAEPGGRGKIIAGKSASSKPEEKDGGRFGKMSEVIVLDHMLDGMSDEELRQEVEGGDLYEEIGTECGEKYGRVMRLFVEREGRRVFIRFTDGVSALRAVNALEGRIFNGNAIVPRFYDLEKFEAGLHK
ncbi:unnamed protein product [Sordaria macrospora k-hell]|uniref:WGS project CABT00000000 data, contig 2.26 n=1 Tax=Sordaria macrospora (strain ATCC MYA-333 / DSM 997 / K(L3346) / K-hell) TaxID=771870 RepID=F7W404_SORMK|nr:uncharacterized protein SMAC_05536 [Sordaria macrospora k-hell]CCC12358.1 unnamed protein product [Sordaria macrospora k-hell]